MVYHYITAILFKDHDVITAIQRAKFHMYLTTLREISPWYQKANPYSALSPFVTNKFEDL
jgi:hypothetical protein